MLQNDPAGKTPKSSGRNIFNSTKNNHMRMLLAAVLLILGIALAAYGVHTYQEATAQLDIFGINLSARDKSGQQSAYLYMALGGIAILAGFLMWRKK